MIVLKSDMKKGYISLKISSFEDLWYLSHIISPGDTITSKTERKIKIGDSDSSQKVIRKTVVLTLKVEDVSLQDDMSCLRVKGTVLQGPEDIPSGSYHTFGLEMGNSFSLEKPRWLHFHKEQLDQSLKATSDSVLFCLFDRETFLFSLLRQSGIKHLTQDKLDLPKKQYVESSSKSDLFSPLFLALKEYISQYSPKNIIFASPDFYRPYIQDQLDSDIKKKSVFITCGDITPKAISSLLTRVELKNILSNQRLQKEESLKENVLQELRNDNLAYGLSDVLTALQAGAIKELIITNSFIQKSRQEGTYQQIDELLQQVEDLNGTIHILSEPSVIKSIDSLGGLVALLRWKLSQ